MAIQAKLTPDELALADIIRHPILGAEFIRNYDVIPEEREGFKEIWEQRKYYPETYYIHTNYQVLMLCDFNNFVTYCTARAIGKTENLIDKIVFYLLNDFWKDYIIFLAPNRVHIEPVFKKLTDWLKTNSFLKHLVNRYSINLSQLNITLLTGAQLNCRIAGQTGTGANVVGLHTPVIMIDEAAYFPWGTWAELQRCLNDWQEGYQVLVAGVPDGRREKSVLYTVDQKDESYTKHRIAAAESPRWSEEAEQRARDQFGGINSEDYIHMVLGQHGSPVFAVFDRAMMAIENYETHYRELRGTDLKDDGQAGYKQLLELPHVPKNSEQVLFGIDLGYTDPTAVVILYLVNGKWYIHARLNWIQIPYDEQEKLISYMDNKFNSELIGVDEGGAGKATVQHLLNDEKYAKRKFTEKLIPINFASNFAIGLDEDGKEIKQRAKEFGVQYLQEKVNTHQIVFPESDDDLITELERTTYTKGPTGQLTFKTFTARGGERGSDHNLAALLSGFLAWYHRHDSLFHFEPKPKLFRPKWIIT